MTHRLTDDFCRLASAVEVVRSVAAILVSVLVEMTHTFPVAAVTITCRGFKAY